MIKTLAFASASIYLKYNAVGLADESKSLNLVRNAICILFPQDKSGVHGIVSFQQDHIEAPTKIAAVVRGLKANSLHGIHIHQFGDLTEGCTSAGPHYNPLNTTHGGPLDEVRHVGDLGNIKTDEQGNGYLTQENKLVKLFGDHSIIGRSVVVHQDEDDLGKGQFPDSKTTGHSGARVACGVIAYSNAFKNIAPY